ncbi:hypothetical protein P389DRAFT_175223 [Cystobasidium minutum MCA 4210]|uniref:uncharacterized protein n=1 Tax=Cystobasidium minutum MCA 4210 TaxID=1397322 RepID=UPI0034CFD8FC|eukprot:jgi/Rhomi1/175223/fgenesh1_kg.9_\
MAALHLLPRELVHLLAASRSTSTNHQHHVSAHRLSSLLRMQQRLPRFSSDYRRVALDSDTARDFDLPSSGYEYPSIAGTAEEPSLFDGASFVEPDDAQYHFDLPLTSAKSNRRNSKTAESSRAADSYVRQQAGDTQMGPSPSSASIEAVVEQIKLSPQDLALSSSRMAMVALGNAANCLKRNDLDSAVSWFIESPPFPSTFASQRARLELLVSTLCAKLLEERSQEMPLLMAFATAAASKGFASLLLRLIPHISRFSPYEKLDPFWKEFSNRARAAAKNSKAETSIDRTLNRIGNRIIRSLCLSENYVDGLKFLRLMRSQGQSSLQPGAKPIESETYRIFLEELRRHDTHPSLYEGVKICSNADYPKLPKVAAEAASTPSNVAGTATEPSNLAQRQAQVDALAASAAEHVQPSATSAKLDYVRLARKAQTGEIIGTEELAHFAELCQRDGVSYLQRSLAKKMAMTSAERQYKALVDEMTEGQLPTTTRLSSFIEYCIQGRQPRLADNLGEWMQNRSMRFRSLWVCARIHRLIRKGEKKAAYDALRIYKQHFFFNGLPQPILDFFKTLDDTPLVIPPAQPTLAQNEEEQGLVRITTENGLAMPTETASGDQPMPSSEHVRVPASSHSIAMAIQAWLQFDGRVENINATYDSFIKVSYLESEDVRTPTHLMPDQVSFGPFLKHLSRLGQTSDAMAVMRGMLRRGVMPNAHNWTTVLGGFAKEGHRNMVSGIMKRMDKAAVAERHGIAPDQLNQELGEAYNRGTNVPYFTASSPKAVNRLLDGFTFYPPTLATYVTVIRGLCLAGDLEKAKYYVRDMFAARTVSGDRLYKFGENKQAETALDVIMQMDKLATLGRVVTYRRTLKRYSYTR